MDRREFIKKAEIAGVGAMLADKQTMAKTANKSKKIKNILVFFADQHRQDCVGCYGNPVVQTPNIDRLAKNGIRFNNAFTPAPVCTPARMSLQSSLWPHKHRLIFNTGNAPQKGGLNDPNPNTKFFSEFLLEKKWKNAHVGKWHIGTEKNKPAAHGYMDLPYYPGYGIPSYIYQYKRNPRIHKHYLKYLKKQGVDRFKLLKQTREDGTLFSGLQEGPQSASIPAYLATQTIDVIKRFNGNNSPFFISCNFWGPHAPYCITKKHYEMYRNFEIEPWPNFDCDLSDKPQVIKRYGEYVGTGWFNRDNISRLIGEYYGYISLIDEEIGRILKMLEDTGELESTLIVYSADHGSSVGSYRMWDKGYGMYDAITRIPMIVSHPSITPAVSDAFVTLLDLAPTFLDTAGCAIPNEIDGASLMPILKGEKKTVRKDHIVTEHHGHHCPFWQRMVRTNSSKYVFNYTATHEFYDLESDPFETKNIIYTVDRKKLKRYEEMLIRWMEESKDPLQNWVKCSLLDNVFPY